MSATAREQLADASARNQLCDAFHWGELVRQLIVDAQIKTREYISRCDIGCSERLSEQDVMDNVDEVFAVKLLSDAALSDFMKWADIVWLNERERQHTDCLACNHGRDIENNYQNWKAER